MLPNHKIQQYQHRVSALAAQNPNPCNVVKKENERARGFELSAAIQFSLVNSSGKTSAGISAVKPMNLPELDGFTIAMMTEDFNRNSV